MTSYKPHEYDPSYNYAKNRPSRVNQQFLLLMILTVLVLFSTFWFAVQMINRQTVVSCHEQALVIALSEMPEAAGLSAISPLAQVVYDDTFAFCLHAKGQQ